MFFFFQAEDGIRDGRVTGVQTCALPICGRGQVIDLPLLDPMFVVLGPQAANYRLTGKVKPRTGSRSTNAAPRNVYRCKDGHYVCLSASIQKMAERVFTSIGRTDMNDDPRYKTNEER